MQIYSMKRRREANDPTKAPIQWMANPPQGPGRFRGSLCGHSFLLVIANTGRTSTKQKGPPRLEIQVTIYEGDPEKPAHENGTVLHVAVRNAQRDIRNFIRCTLAQALAA
jgi:hypothetical protein